MALATEVDRSASALSRIETILGDDAGLLQYQCRGFRRKSSTSPVRISWIGSMRSQIAMCASWAACSGCSIPVD